MATKGVWQLCKFTIRYCDHSGSSRYVREFMKSPMFSQFALANQQVEFHTKVHSGHHPVLIGEYVTADVKVCDIKNKSAAFIQDQMLRMRNTSGRKMTRIEKPVKTSNPSVQGLWEQNIVSSDFRMNHHT